MSRVHHITFTAGLLFAMGACTSSSSSDPDQVSRVLTGPDALNIGTTSTTDSGNGLPFGDEAFDPEGDIPPMTIRLVRFISNNETGETFVQVTEETLTAVDLVDRSSLTGTITFGNETITLTNGEATLSDGRTLFVEEALGGDYSSIANAYAYVDAAPGEPGFNTDGMFALGLQTNPAAMPTTMGTSTYLGDFIGYGTIQDLNGEVLQSEVFVDGVTTINARFADNRIGGTLAFETNAAEGVAVPFNVNATLQLDETDIVGNGFGTTANTVVGCASVECSSSTLIGGAFFGPSADEVSGVAGIDYSEGNGAGDGVRLIAAGGFIATPDAPE